MAYVPRLKEKYKKEIVPALTKKFEYKSVMQVPRLTKICVNQGVGDAVSDKKLIEYAITEMSNVTGQKAVPTKSKKDISNFKLRVDVAIGVRVTPVSYTHLRAHETVLDLVCRLLLEKKKIPQTHAHMYST